MKDCPSPIRYWSAREVAENGIARSFSGSTDEAVLQLDTLLRDSVKMRMIADVPLGALLSGGIDSSTVVALMQAQSARPVKTFTIGFKERGYNEAVHAAAVARHLGTEHTELYLTPGDAMDLIPRLPDIYDEPFADSSQVPTFLVCELARRHVTVSLSGDGGDELFGGYLRYILTRRIHDAVGAVPQAIRRAIAAGLTVLSPENWDALFETIRFMVPNGFKQPGDKLHKLAALMVLEDYDAMYTRLVSVSKDCASWVLAGSEPCTTVTNRSEWAALPDSTLRMMYLDLVTYLPDDILVKLDRASMSVSLEGRVPILDHRVVEFAWRLPLCFKLREGKGKWLLRQVLYKYVPKKLVDRPKAGFAVPIAGWLRGPLREWAEALLEERRLAQDGFLNPGPIRETWARHLSGRANFQYELWNVLMFQAWLEKQKNLSDASVSSKVVEPQARALSSI
jgi:asparagine synthase (glutamine-hydrolysing)